MTSAPILAARAGDPLLASTVTASGLPGWVISRGCVFLARMASVLAAQDCHGISLPSLGVSRHHPLWAEKHDMQPRPGLLGLRADHLAVLAIVKDSMTIEVTPHRPHSCCGFTGQLLPFHPAEEDASARRGRSDRWHREQGTAVMFRRSRRHCAKVGSSK